MKMRPLVQVIVCLGLLLAPVTRAQTPTDTAQVSSQAPAGGQTASSAPQAPAPDPKTYDTVFKAVFLLFMLAAILESALAILFNWRPFVETFNARAVRPLVSFVVAYAIVRQFDFDLVTTIVNATKQKDLAAGLIGEAVTALAMAGGSAGVNNLLITLGYRQRQTPETVAPKPPPDKAWIAVRLDRQQAVGPVEVFVGAKPPGGVPPLVGVISGASKPGLRYFLRDPGRFPGYGGHAVPANSEVAIELVGVDPNGSQVRKSWGPSIVAGGAVIDLQFVL